MPLDILSLDFLKWMLTTTGATATVLAISGYVFREKWKQILARSLAQDLERLKHDLVMKQAEHAATLTPQLELIKHDFQQKLEAYKVSLIAQAEEVKIRGDVKKLIASRYVEIRFERFVQLEKDLSRTGASIMSLVTYPTHLRHIDQAEEALSCIQPLAASAAECEMFLDGAERIKLAVVIGMLVSLIARIGPEKEPMPMKSPEWEQHALERLKVEDIIRDKIHAMAEI